MDALSSPDHEVVIVGAGFSGIGAAILLDKAGISDYLIIEEGHGVGGAWHWNTYPGIAVDIPSFSYQFSFETRADSTWSAIPLPATFQRFVISARPLRYGCVEMVALVSATA